MENLTDIKRIIGRCGGHRPGPTLVIVGGVHGNEPAGVEAAHSVVERITEDSIPVRGELTVLAGNTRALRESVRFLDRDLNRLWSDERIRAISHGGVELGGGSEDREQKELLDALLPLMGVADRSHPRIFMDLHTYSSEGPPFLIGSLAGGNVALARALHLPLIVGLQQAIGGALTEFMLESFDASYAVEGGLHHSAEARLHHQAVIWTTLVEVGMVDAADCPRWGEFQQTLVDSGAGHPPLTKLIYHHQIQDHDQFQMDPGFRTFQPVQEGQRLATDRQGEVVAPTHGVLVMPLYQAQGSDGFFLGRELELA